MLLGYVLSGSTTSEAVFEPIEAVEDSVREGMLVVVEDRGRKILGIVVGIEVYNEFYEKGSVWSEAIRKKKLPPQQVARRYTIAGIQFYGELSGGSLRTVSRPPAPGSSVYEAEPSHLSGIYGYTPLEEEPPPSIIEVGSLYGYHRLPAALDLEKLPMHMAVIGVTGSGKSNTMGVIIEKLGSKRSVAIGGYTGKTVPVLVFDANGDYLDYYDDASLVPSYRVVRFVSPAQHTRISQSPGAVLEELILDLNAFYDSPSELAEAVYALTRGGSVEGLELQLDLLTRVLYNAREDREAREACPGPQGYSVDLNCLLASNDGIDALRRLLDREVEDKRAHQTTAQAVARALLSFKERVRKHGIVDPHAEPSFTPDFVDDVVDPDRPGLVIIDMSAEGMPGLDLRDKQFIVYYVLRLLFNKFVEYRARGENRVLMVVVEEAQNYAPNQREYPIGFSVARTVLAGIATQGRKFGLSLALVTQRPAFVDPVIMSMMNTFIVHRVSPGDIRFVQVATGGLPRHIASRLPRLETGLAIIVGQMNKFPQPVMASIEKRRSHRAGSV